MRADLLLTAIRYSIDHMFDDYGRGKTRPVRKGSSLVGRTLAKRNKANKQAKAQRKKGRG